LPSRNHRHDVCLQSQSQPLQLLAVAFSALRGGAHAGQHVLLDGQPVVVTALREEVDDSRQVYAAASEFAEHARADGFRVTHTGSPRFGGYLGLTVLEVNVGYSFPEPLEAVERQATVIGNTATVRVVTGIEHQIEQ